MKSEDLIRRLHLDGTSTAREAAKHIEVLEDELIFLRRLSVYYSESEKRTIRAEIAKMNAAAIAHLEERKME